MQVDTVSVPVSQSRDLNRKKPVNKRFSYPLSAIVLAAAAWSGAGQAQEGVETSRHWIAPGAKGSLPATASYDNPWGKNGIFNAGGAIDMEGHAFFESRGSNGRACVTCHQPADSMGLSLDSIRERWALTQGEDPLFALYDGANCPNLTRGVEDSHSLLLNRGLFRVSLPWPRKGPDGQVIDSEFSIEVVRDPTGCNTNPIHGIDGEEQMISVYRRPRVVANLKYIAFEVGPFNAKRLAMVNDRDPETGAFVSMNIMADAREPTLKTQAMSAAYTHLEAHNGLTQADLHEIIAFEEQIYSAQIESKQAGPLQYEGGPEALGPLNMEDNERGLGDNFTTPLFMHFDMWRDDSQAETQEQKAFRASVARGHDVFFLRPFDIKDTAHINTVGLGNPVKRSCATCHNAVMTGTDVTAGWVDVGSTNLPFAEEVVEYPWADQTPDLPLFKITCDEQARPHPFLGREIYTQDPGRALISGKCYDVGSIVMGQMRGLAARAPYFSNGSMESLRDMIDFYDRRFNIRYTEQEKIDLVNFLSVL